MRYPIIKVRDKLTGETHIVGTDTHDVLYISDDGGIHYYNLQNGEGTGRNGDYEFVGVDNEFSPGPEIEFVLVDQTEVQRLREALERIRKIAKESREAKYHVDNYLLIEVVAEQALSTTTEPTNAAKVERVREPVAWFAQQMEAKLRENDHKGGWENCTLGYLITRLRDEVCELEELIERGVWNEETICEAADVANFAMMIADNARRMVEGDGNDA